MNAAVVRVGARAATRCEHVFGDRLVDAETARWAARIDAAFLTEAGWDVGLLVLFPPAEHPLLGRPVCRVVGCATTASHRSRVCLSCRRRLDEHGLSVKCSWRVVRAPQGGQFRHQLLISVSNTL